MTRIIRVIAGLIFAVVVLYPFRILGDAPILLWDESRRAVNALEMLQNGNYLVPHFLGHPDMWGTKPPLLIWGQVISMKLLGINEWGVRFPSMVAALMLMVLLLLFAKKAFNSFWPGIFGSLILMTSFIFFREHGFLTGDYDILLTLWQMGYFSAFYFYVQSKQARFLYAMGGFILLAAWTKGIAGLFYLPGIVVFSLCYKQARFVFKDKKVYTIALLTIVGIISYYLIRESINPGYIKAVLHNEVVGRYIEGVEGGRHYLSYYFYVLTNAVDRHFFPWIFFVPVAILWIWLKTPYRAYLTLSLSIVITFLLVISGSATRIFWYCIPVVPLLALLVGTFLYTIVYWILVRLKLEKALTRSLLLMVFSLMVFYKPYLTNQRRSLHFSANGPHRQEREFRDFLEKIEDHKAYSILIAQYNANPIFYGELQKLQGDKIAYAFVGAPASFQLVGAKVKPEFSRGQQVVVCEKQAEKWLVEHFIEDKLEEEKGCKLFRIR